MTKALCFINQDGAALVKSILIGKNHTRTPLRACGANVVNANWTFVVNLHMFDPRPSPVRPPFVPRPGGFWYRFGGLTASCHWKFGGRQIDSLK